MTRGFDIVIGIDALGRGQFEMQVFLYEFATGGGFLASQEPPAGPLLAEGQAMIQALIADFSAMPDVQVVTTRDSRLSAFKPPACQVTDIASAADEWQAILRLAAASDWTLLIAPETANALLDRTQQVESLEVPLLSPSSACIKIAANKQTTADLLIQSGVPTPKARALPQGASKLPHDLQYPLVMKPIDGCASQGVRFIPSPADWPDLSEKVRVEEFIPGLPASVAVLCGPAGIRALPACEQLLSSDGHLKYLGGRLPLAPNLNNRACRLARAAIQALPQPLGYVGVDLVLGDAADGSGDYVIEINPRLTTSYIGLRHLARQNLAAALLAIATGHQPNISFSSSQLEFTANGKLTQAGH